MGDTWLTARGRGPLLHIHWIREASCQYTWSGSVLTNWWDFMPYLSMTPGCWIQEGEVYSGTDCPDWKGSGLQCDSRTRLSALCFKKQYPTSPLSLVSLEESSCTQGCGSFYVILHVALWLWWDHEGGCGMQSVTDFRLGVPHQVQHRKKKTTVSVSHRKKLA